MSLNEPLARFIFNGSSILGGVKSGLPDTTLLSLTEAFFFALSSFRNSLIRKNIFFMQGKRLLLRLKRIYGAWSLALVAYNSVSIPNALQRKRLLRFFPKLLPFRNCKGSTFVKF